MISRVLRCLTSFFDSEATTKRTKFMCYLSFCHWLQGRIYPPGTMAPHSLIAMMLALSGAEAKWKWRGAIGQVLKVESGAQENQSESGKLDFFSPSPISARWSRTGFRCTSGACDCCCPSAHPHVRRIHSTAECGNVVVYSKLCRP